MLQAQSWRIFSSVLWWCCLSITKGSGIWATPGQSPSRKWIWCILSLKECIWRQQIWYRYQAYRYKLCQLQHMTLHYIKGGTKSGACDEAKRIKRKRLLRILTVIDDSNVVYATATDKQALQWTTQDHTGRPQPKNTWKKKYIDSRI